MSQEETGAARIRVFLLDDHEVVRRGVRDLLEAEPDITVVGEAGPASSALARIPAVKPDVAVLDVRPPDGDGVSVCREIRSAMPHVACLMLTSFSDDEALSDAIMAGAAGYVLKQIRGTDLVGTVRTVAAGGSLLDPRAASRVMKRMRDQAQHADPLAGREEQILELIGEGLTNRQIGQRMLLAEKTVKNYVSGLLHKLGMQRRTRPPPTPSASSADTTMQARPAGPADRDRSGPGRQARSRRAGMLSRSARHAGAAARGLVPRYLPAARRSNQNGRMKSCVGQPTRRHDDVHDRHSGEEAENPGDRRLAGNDDEGCCAGRARDQAEASGMISSCAGPAQVIPVR